MVTWQEPVVSKVIGAATTPPFSRLDIMTMPEETRRSLQPAPSPSERSPAIASSAPEASPLHPPPPSVPAVPAPPPRPQPSPPEVSPWPLPLPLRPEGLLPLPPPPTAPPHDGASVPCSAVAFCKAPVQKPPRQARMALHQAPGLLVFSERRNNKRWMFPPKHQEFYLGVPNGLSVGTLPSPAKSMPLAPPPPPALPPRAQPPGAPPQSAAPQAPSSPLGGGLCEPPQKKAKIGLADAAEAAKSGQAACQDVSMSATDVDPALPRPGLLEGATPKSQARV